VGHPRLIEFLSDLYPGSEQVLDAGLGGAGDDAVWEYAQLHGLATVSKDSDFFDRSVLASNPPKIIWIQSGNCSTRDVARMLRAQVEAVRRFLEDDGETCLKLGRR
jgi:predicted nuclease of predicted toxin-antitoxin system